jgi:hypothetical protein
MLTLSNLKASWQLTRQHNKPTKRRIMWTWSHFKKKHRILPLMLALTWK